MSRYRIGIDPGVSGALVLLDGGALSPVEWMRMPTITVGRAKRVDGAEIARWIHRSLMSPDVHAYLELVGAMPGQGVTSMFAFGHAAGSVCGVLAALQIPATYVTPQAWKRRAGLIGKDKDAARSRAIQLWPAWDALGKKGEGQALADAALIARFGESA